MKLDLSQLEKELQMAVQGELTILAGDYELELREAEGFELVIDLDGLSFADIRAAIYEAYDEFNYDDGETLMSVFLEENDMYTERETEMLIAKLGEDLDALKATMAELSGTSVSRDSGFKTA